MTMINRAMARRRTGSSRRTATAGQSWRASMPRANGNRVSSGMVITVNRLEMVVMVTDRATSARLAKL